MFLHLYPLFIVLGFEFAYLFVGYSRFHHDSKNRFLTSWDESLGSPISLVQSSYLVESHGY